MTTLSPLLLKLSGAESVWLRCGATFYPWGVSSADTDMAKDGVVPVTTHFTRHIDPIGPLFAVAAVSVASCCKTEKVPDCETPATATVVEVLNVEKAIKS